MCLFGAMMQVAAPPARPASSPHTSAATTQQSFSTARAMRFDRVLVRHRRVTSAGRSLFRPDLLGLINDLFAQPVLVWMLGALMLGAGLVIIGGHRNWRGPLAVTMSLFGWFVALRGFLLIANPTAIQSGVDATMLSPTATTLARIFFGALAVAGLLLTYAGWFTNPAVPNPSAPTTTVRATRNSPSNLT